MLDELARKREITPIDSLGRGKPESSLGAAWSPSITKGRCEAQSESDILALKAHFREG